MRSSLTELLSEVRACSVCEAHLPEGPRPIVQVGEQAKILIIGQAPGRRVHESGVPWDDPSGERLRTWLGLSAEQFYDASLVALVPMGFCYPGRGRSGDAPPRPECAPLWHERLIDHVPADRLEILIGSHAQARYLPEGGRSLTEKVARWNELLPSRVALPHPSPRNRRWLANNPWFDRDVVPALQARVRAIVADQG